MKNSGRASKNLRYQPLDFAKSPFSPSRKENAPEFSLNIKTFKQRLFTEPQSPKSEAPPKKPRTSPEIHKKETHASRPDRDALTPPPRGDPACPLGQKTTKGSKSKDISVCSNRCSNHESKKASFTVREEGKQKFVCGKCAIEYAKKGIEPSELDDQEDERKFRIGQFLSKLKNQKQICEGQLKELMKESESFLKTEKIGHDQIISYFDSIIKTIIDKRNEILKSAKSYYDGAKSFFETQISNLNEKNEELKAIQFDIEENLDRIIQKIEMDSFNIILGNYEEKLTVSSKLVDLIDNFQLASPPFSEPEAEVIESSIENICNISVVPKAMLSSKSKPKKKSKTIEKVLTEKSQNSDFHSEEKIDRKKTPEIAEKTKSVKTKLNLEFLSTRTDSQPNLEGS